MVMDEIVMEYCVVVLLIVVAEGTEKRELLVTPSAYTLVLEPWLPSDEKKISTFVSGCRFVARNVIVSEEPSVAVYVAWDAVSVISVIWHWHS